MRTNNTLRVTFSASVDAGEGFLTDRNLDTLNGILDYGWLWAMDVLGDWKGEIDWRREQARAGYLGWYHKVSPNEEPIVDVKMLAIALFEHGCEPSSPCKVAYEFEAGCAVNEAGGTDIDSYGNSGDFRREVHRRAAERIRGIVDQIVANGVSAPDDVFSSVEKLERFCLIAELASRILGAHDEGRPAVPPGGTVIHGTQIEARLAARVDPECEHLVRTAPAQQ